MGQPEASSAIGAQATPVVLDRDDQLVVVEVHADQRPAGRRVLADVRERLLDDPEDLGLTGRRQPQSARRVVGGHGRDQLRGVREPDRVALEGVNQVVVGRNRAVQAQDRLTDVDVDGACRR